MAAGESSPEESPSSTEQGARRKPGRRGHRADSPAERAKYPEERACGPPAREQQRRAGVRPDETGNPPCCNLRSGRTRRGNVALSVARRDRKSRAAAEAMTRPTEYSVERDGHHAARSARTELGLHARSPRSFAMVPLAQLAEHSPVERVVTGSSPVRHPNSHSCALVAQLDRASDFGSEGWGFESLRAYHPLHRNESSLRGRP